MTKQDYKILIVDDDQDIIRLIKKIFDEKGINTYSATTSDQCLTLLGNFNRNGFNLLIIDYDLGSGSTGLEIINYIRDKQLNIPVIMISGIDIDKNLFLGEGAFAFVSKPFYGPELYYTVMNLKKLFETYRGLEDANSIISALSIALDARDTYTEGHSTRVFEYATMLYHALGFKDKEEERILKVGCLLHDIGKIGIPDSILKSENELSKLDREIINQHPIKGYEICKDIKNLNESLSIIRNHHEKCDGSGYPDGLKGDEIPKLVHITTIADIFDALISKRPYRKENTIKEALDILEYEADDNKLNKYYVSTFRKMVFDKIKER